VIKRPQRILKGCQILVGADDNDSNARVETSELMRKFRAGYLRGGAPLRPMLEADPARGIVSQ
jgi:hypothetical protein